MIQLSFMPSNASEIEDEPAKRSRPRFAVLAGVILWALTVAILVSVGLFSPAMAVDTPTIGINYNWYQLRAEQIPECKAHSAWVLWGGGIVQQYSDQKIRDAVRGQLARMRSAGFHSMRVILHASHLPADHKEGLIHTVSGDISIEDQNNIRNFVSDVAMAGFQGLEVSFGFQQDGKIFCKINEWGDCFDPARTDANWRFIDGSTALVKSSAQSMSLRFDLDNEGCIAPSMPSRTISNAKRYLATIATRFREKYGNDEWLISCPDSQRAVRLAAMLEGLREVNLKPKFVEIHTYKEDPDHVREVIATANEIATQIDAKVVLGELKYHSEIQEKIIHNFIHNQRNSRIVDVLQWPLAVPETKCPIDVQPPYDPGPYGQE